jgi:hypothetical protein
MNPKILVSYSHKDRDTVKLVASTLSRRGCDVWQDTDKLMGGDRIIPKISQALTETDFYLIFVSQDSVKSQYVIFELNMAISLYVRKGKPIIIPIILDGTPAPDMLEGMKYIKFESFTQATDEIMRTISITYPSQVTVMEERVEQKQELILSSFSFYLCEETRSINSFEYHELEEKTREMGKHLKRIANKLVLPFIKIEDIELNKSSEDVNFPNVSFTEILNDRGAIDIRTKEVCLETEILNPDENKILQFISGPRENTKAIKYVFLLPRSIPDLAGKVTRKIIREHLREIDQFDSQSVTYSEAGRKYAISCTDQQIKIKVESTMPVVRNADIEKFNIRDIAKKLIPE